MDKWLEGMDNWPLAPKDVLQQAGLMQGEKNKRALPDNDWLSPAPSSKGAGVSTWQARFRVRP
jgi:hypothetical protein